MALPNPPTSANGSKLFAATFDSAGTNTAAVVKAIEVTTMNSENTCHLGVATHAEDATWASGDPCVVIAGIEGTNIQPFPIETAAAAIGTLGVPVMGTDGTNARLLSTNTSGHVNIADGGNSITVDFTGQSVSVSGTVTVGTHAVTQSGTWNVGTVTTVSAVTAISNALPAGTNMLGGIADAGWDATTRPIVSGSALNVTTTAEQTVLAADRGKIYNITDVFLTYWTGSAAPAGSSAIKITLRLGTASGGEPIFFVAYVPHTSEQVREVSVQYKMPVQSGAGKAISAIVSGALGTSGEYSIWVNAYKTT